MITKVIGGAALTGLVAVMGYGVVKNGVPALTHPVSYTKSLFIPDPLHGQDEGSYVMMLYKTLDRAKERAQGQIGEDPIMVKVFTPQELDYIRYSKLDDEIAAHFKMVRLFDWYEASVPNPFKQEG